MGIVLERLSILYCFFLYRSKIQGLGLYAARDIEKNTMIIEYIGEIIRSELAEVITVFLYFLYSDNSITSWLWQI